MITSTYLLMTLLPVLVGIAIWRGVAGDRDNAMRFLVGAIALGIAAALLGFATMHARVNDKGYARAQAAARLSPDADAVMQTAMQDDVITMSEYAAIASAYEQNTGRSISEVEKASTTTSTVPTRGPAPRSSGAVSSDTTLPAPSAAATADGTSASAAATADGTSAGTPSPPEDRP